jgi:hypothetical protein
VAWPSVKDMDNFTFESLVHYCKIITNDRWDERCRRTKRTIYLCAIALYISSKENFIKLATRLVIAEVI